MKHPAGGSSLHYRVDWEKNEMVLLGAQGGLESITEPDVMPLSPMFRALKLKYLGDSAAKAQRRFIIDVACEGEHITISLHQSNDFGSVVNVARTLVEQLLWPTLTPREVEVAVELFEGRTIRYIACTLCIAEGTVKRTIHNIYQKMNVSSQVELIREIYARLAENAGQSGVSSEE